MLKHNKKKNSYIIYEQLLSLATRLAAQKRKDEVKFVLNFIKEHFSQNSVLGHEKKIFDSLVNTNDLSDKDAQDVLQESLNQASCLDSIVLEKAKNKLINDITNKLSADLFSVPIREYKLLASTQIILNETRNKFQVVTPVEKNRIKNQILKNLTKQTIVEDSEKIDNMTYNILLNKFNKKYSDVINEDQRELLKAWSLFLVNEDKNTIKDLLEQKLKLIKETVKKNINIKSDISELLKEANEKLSNKKIDQIDEELIYEFMRYFDLVEDLS